MKLLHCKVLNNTKESHRLSELELDSIDLEEYCKWDDIWIKLESIDAFEKYYKNPNLSFIFVNGFEMIINVSVLELLKLLENES